MTTDLELQKKKGDFAAMVKRFTPQIAEVMPAHVDPARFARLLMSAASRNPVLLDCDQKTVFLAVLAAAQLGLDPVGSLGSAYILPYKNRKAGRYEAQLIIGYRGLIDLARRSGQVQTIEAHCIHEGDTFEEIYGTERRLRFVPNRNDRGPILGAFAFATLTGGGSQWEVMSRDEIEAIRRGSKGGSTSFSPWSTHWSEMARKTVVRRLCKYLPLSPELVKAVDVEDNGAEAVIDLDPSMFSTEQAPPTPAPTASEALEERLSKAGVKAGELPLGDGGA